MKSIITWQAVLWFATYLTTGLAMLFVFMRAYMWTTPYDDHDEVRQGRLAATIALSGAMVGYTIPLAVCFRGNFYEFIAWGIFAGVVQLLLSKAMHKYLPGEIEKDNCAASLLFAAAAICVGLLNAFALIP